MRILLANYIEIKWYKFSSISIWTVYKGIDFVRKKVSFKVEKEKYYDIVYLLEIEFLIKCDIQAEHSSKNIGIMLGFFFVSRKMSKCRSPPLFNLILKKQIERRNERWQIAQKEENIGIIPIL